MSIKFRCPDCGHDKLECVMDGVHSCSVTSIDEEGDMEFGEMESYGDVERWQCDNCGWVVPDGEANMTDQQEVAEWCQENCPQD